MNNPTTASPVTRSAEVQKAIGVLTKYLHASEWGQHTVVKENLPALLAHIANLEASQPKPFEQQGRERNGQYAHKGDVCICGHAAGIHAGEKPHPCFNEDTGIAGATGVSCKCVKFKAAKPKPQSDEGMAHVVSELMKVIPEPYYSHGVKLLKASRQAPVPTSDAVEVARNIIWTIGPKIDDDDATVAKAAAIIQQAMDGARAEAVKFCADSLAFQSQQNEEDIARVKRIHLQNNKADGKSELPLPHGFFMKIMPDGVRRIHTPGGIPLYMELGSDAEWISNGLMATQPPAADGKLREALHALQVGRGYVLGVQRSLNAGAPAQARERIDKALAVLEKPILEAERAALAQPASGGGE